jgi:hypothetical protein
LQDAEEAERRDKMNGAESLVRTLVGGEVEVCFANPGTSEMHFVAALDRVDGAVPTRDRPVDRAEISRRLTVGGSVASTTMRAVS